MALHVTRTPLVGAPVTYSGDDTNAARGASLTTAIGQISVGDTLTIVTGATYEPAGELTFPVNCSLIGGDGTTITSSDENRVAIFPGNNTVESIHFWNQRATGNAIWVESGGCAFSDCAFTGNSDSVSITETHGGTYSEFHDCAFNGPHDVFTVLSGNIDLFDCEINGAGVESETKGLYTRTEGSTILVRMYGGSITMLAGGGTDIYGVHTGADEGTNTVELHGVTISTPPGKIDLHQGNGTSIVVYPGTVYDPTKVEGAITVIESPGGIPSGSIRSSINSPIRCAIGPGISTDDED